MMQNKKPIIGISGGFIGDPDKGFKGYELSYVSDDYVQSVIRAGGVPLILPISESPEVIAAQVALVDGFVISGGADVDPAYYGEEVLQKNGDISPRRDVFDSLLIEMALESHKPILGICRGMQMMNVVGGGSLYQDLSYIENCTIKHVQGQLPTVAMHTVEIEEGSILHGIFGSEVRTNTFHHQAIKDLAPGYKIVAKSKDGLVEAIEKMDTDTHHSFVVGVQWHPEMMSSVHENMHALFKRFIESIY